MPRSAKPRKTSANLVPALDRALEVVELISSHPQGMGLSEIAATLDIPKNLVFRITQTLLAHAYLSRDEKSLSFYLTGKFLELGFRARGDGDLVSQAVDVMKGLRDECLETVLLGALGGDHGVVLHQVAGSHPFRFWVEPGTRIPLHASAPGKAILAALPKAEQEQILSRLEYIPYNSRTLKNRGALEATFQTINRHGWALDDAEQMEGVTCIGAAILDAHGYPVGALWITGPSDRLPAGRIADLGGMVSSHARQVSRRLGHGYFDSNAGSLGVAS